DPNKYRCGIVKPFTEDYSEFSLTVDTLEDLKRFRFTMKHFKEHAEHPEEIKLKEILNFYQNNDSLPALKLSSGGKIKLPYGKTISFEEFKLDMKKRVDESFQLNLY